MWKRALTLMMLSVLTSLMMAQKNYAPLGATWAYEGHSLYCTGDHQLFKVKGEIIIDEKDCSVIYSYYADDLNPEFTWTGDSLIVWEDNGKVYFLEDTLFYLLYDFTVNIGDTVYYYDPLDKGLFSSLWYDVPPDVPVQLALRVTGVEEVTIDNQSLKKFATESVYDSLCVDQRSIIENIGSTTHGMTGVWCYFVAEGCFGGLVCYENDLISYESGILNCDFTSSIGYAEIEKEIHLYPNPTTDWLNFDFPEDLYPATIEILNATMARIAVLPVNGFDGIDLQHLDQGIYFIRINHDKGPAIVRRIVKI